MDDADAAGLRHGDGEPRLGDRVHGRRNDGQVEADRAGQPGRDVGLRRQHLRVARLQQHVVEGERFAPGDHVDDAGHAKPPGERRPQSFFARRISLPEGWRGRLTCGRDTGPRLARVGGARSLPPCGGGAGCGKGRELCAWGCLPPLAPPRKGEGDAREIGPRPDRPEAIKEPGRFRRPLSRVPPKWRGRGASKEPRKFRMRRFPQRPARRSFLPDLPLFSRTGSSGWALRPAPLSFHRIPPPRSQTHWQGAHSGFPGGPFRGVPSCGFTETPAAGAARSSPKAPVAHPGPSMTSGMRIIAERIERV